MPVINTNVNAIIARNSGAVNDRNMTKAMQSLSTGKRINVAADDAAGLAISTKMTAQIRGLDQAVRNANDGIAMLQVVEGATVEMTNMLQRMRELAVQSANDTNTTTERSYLNDEYTQLKAEIDRIAHTTQWNGENVMDGTGSIGAAHAGGSGGVDVKYQVGANAGQTISFNVVNFGTSVTSSAASTGSVKLTDAATAAEYNVVVVGSTAVQITGLGGGGAVSKASDSDWTTFASGVQTAIRALGGYDDVTVTAEAGYKLSFSHASGEDVTIKLGKYDSAAPATPAAPASGSALSVTVTGGTVASSTAAGIFVAHDLEGTDADSTALNASQIDTQANSNIAVKVLDQALKDLNAQRSAMGATINRLTYAADNLTNTSANVTAARSRVLDTDYASATTELARTQIIQQASTAMLAQANQGAQSVLSLLK